MLAPIDKLSNPHGNDIIQIVVTTRCDRNCSNCTQLLPFRVDYAFMSLDCFEGACISVKDWPGLVAMFGGNPCVHPQFPELCRIMAKHITPEHRAKLAGLRINSEVYRTSRHRMVERDRAGNGERPQPCQPVRKITETFAEKNPRLEQVGCIGADALSP